jgi:hypothetical protein
VPLTVRLVPEPEGQKGTQLKGLVLASIVDMDCGQTGSLKLLMQASPLL